MNGRRYSLVELDLLKKKLYLFDSELSALIERTPEAIKRKRLRMRWLKPQNNRRRGNRHPMWKGGRTISSHGYVLIKMPHHHLADCRGYVYEHRLIVEQKLGRELLPGEIVHHRDGNKLNNIPENIEIYPSVAYHKYQHRKNIFLRKPNEPNPVIKCLCGCGKQLLKYDSSGRPREFITGHRRRFLYWHKKYCEEKILCECGCGTLIRKYDKHKGRPRRFVPGHNLRNQNVNLPFTEKQVYCHF
ncbi:MAG: HNH endonuclease [Elusimicrobiota bacterium]